MSAIQDGLDCAVTYFNEEYRENNAWASWQRCLPHGEEEPAWKLTLHKEIISPLGNTSFVSRTQESLKVSLTLFLRRGTLDTREGRPRWNCRTLCRRASTSSLMFFENAYFGYTSPKDSTE